MSAPNAHSLIASRRLTRLVKNLAQRGRLSVGYTSAQTPEVIDRVHLGGVSADILEPRVPELVPRNYDNGDVQSVLEHLRWLLQKDVLRQDVCLLGPPGSGRRRLALRFAQLTRREVEFLTLTRDTTAADLKQRREIRVDSATGHVDTCVVDEAPVRAALFGRLLVLDGIEKAERNVLPTLNNLLENREMQLDDGRFLVAPERFDELLASKKASESELRRDGILRVDPRFRVIGIGQPVPRFRGFALDPPLRSRFQARAVDLPRSASLLLEDLTTLYPHVPVEATASVASVAAATSAMEHAASSATAAVSNASPYLSAAALHHVMQLLQQRVLHRQRSLVETVSDPVGGAIRADVVDDAFRRDADSLPQLLARAFPTHLFADGGDFHERFCEVVERFAAPHSVFSVRADGQKNARNSEAAVRFVDDVALTPRHEQLVAAVVRDICAGRHVCLVGDKGEGKSVIAKVLADTVLQRPQTYVSLYKDMSSSDLLQRRSTDARGNTVWQHSAVVQAALDGHVVVLDGLERGHVSTLAALASLLQGDDLHLPDGSVLLRSDRYDDINRTHTSDQRPLLRVSPHFRVVATAQKPDKKNRWLTNEVATWFSYHTLPQLEELSSAEQVALVSPGHGDGEVARRLLQLRHELNQLEGQLKLNLRQLARFAQYAALFGAQDELARLIQNNLLYRFLPSSVRDDVSAAMQRCGWSTQHGSQQPENTVIVENASDQQVDFGGVRLRRFEAQNPELVPSPVFFDVEDHKRVLAAMARDFAALETHAATHKTAATPSLLLIGPQGVGKNKLADRFCQLLNREREYMQLHRDTTVESLTVTPKLVDGVVQYDESALVKAARNGRILVLDEADKAPLEVVCVLKNLLADGHMTLANGDKLTKNKEIHADFSVIVLANRADFPFLGNDFFREVGDVFACHAIDNMDEASERALLKFYAPTMDDEVIETLVRIFNDLRRKCDDGVFTYPYSTRELVSIVRHLSAFPADGLLGAVDNVLHFDKFDKQTRQSLHEVFVSHGVPLRADLSMFRPQLRLAPAFLPTSEHVLTLVPRGGGTVPVCPTERFGGLRARTARLPVSPVSLAKYDQVRTEVFGEVRRRFDLKSSVRAAATLPFLDANRRNAENAENAKNDEASDVFVTVSAEPLSLNVHFLGGSAVSTRRINCDGLLPPLLHTADPARDAEISVTEDHVVVAMPTLDLLLVVPRAALHQAAVRADVRADEGDAAVAVRLVPLREEGRPRGSALSWFARGRAAAARRVFWSVGGGVATFSQSSNSLRFFRFLKEDASGYDETVLELPFRFHSLMREDDGALCRDTSGALWRLRADARAGFAATPVRADVAETAKIESIGALDGHVRGGFFAGEQSLLRLCSDGVVEKLQHAALREAAAALTKSTPTALLPECGVACFACGSSVCAVDTKSQEVRVVELPERRLRGFDALNHEQHSQLRWAVQTGRADVSVSELEVRADAAPTVALLPTRQDGDLLLLRGDGECVQLQLDAVKLAQQQAQFRRLFGIRADADGAADEQKKRLQLEFDSKKHKMPTMPKHGKVDPTGAPHVGGNTWAGGSGGADTAGLGGVGGPYRLGGQEQVYQVPEEVKQSLDKDVAAAASDMSKAALRRRLEEIGMSQFDSALYERLKANIRDEVRQLAAVLQSAEAKKGEREWMRSQLNGVLDETRIVDAATGRKNVFRRRGRPQLPLGAPQRLPKRLSFVLDCSGSMYRFNGADQRLDRCVETAVLLMEALAQASSARFEYSIAVHSGDGPRTVLVPFGQAPKTDAERLRVAQRMVAHSQYCASGDHTVEATQAALDDVVQEEADEHFVFVVSDANFRRYGIDAADFASVMTSQPKAHCHVVFIASFGDEAAALAQALPPGKAHVCTRTDRLPHLMKQIFASSGVLDQDD